MFITLYVFDELSYDKYPEQAGQIYRVALNVTGNGGIDTYPDVDVAVGAVMKSTSRNTYYNQAITSAGNFY